MALAYPRFAETKRGGPGVCPGCEVGKMQSMEIDQAARTLLARETPRLDPRWVALFDQAAADLRESGGDAPSLLAGALNGLEGASTQAEEALCGAVAYVAALRVVADSDR